MVEPFDLTDSTKLKQQRGFPGWLPDLIKFQETIFKHFESEISWYKFLGDAYMFFFPDKQHTKITQLKSIKVDEILRLCELVMNEYWKFYSIYSDKERGGSENKEFRQMTCAIDCGKEIINWRQFIDANLQESELSRFDPIGTPIDRCFRISSLAGPSQTLISNNFYQQILKVNNRKVNIIKKYEKISIAENTLKGFPKETTVYYLIPTDKQIDYIISEKNVELVEKAPKMSTKIKIKLLRNKAKSLQKKH